MENRVHIEVILKGQSCLACVYMEEAVLDVMPQYGWQVDCRRVDLFTERGKKRFLELSCGLFGQSGVYKHHRLAPVPGLFIDGELVFDAIPSRDELIAVIDEKLVDGVAPDPPLRCGNPERSLCAKKSAC